MSEQVPEYLQYTRTHEWVRDLANGQVEIGITDHAQQALGDLVFVEVPQVGREVKAGEACAVVESVKAASDIYSPVAGRVAARNDELAKTPELLNSDPYGAGWLMRVDRGSAPAAPAPADGRGVRAVRQRSRVGAPHAVHSAYSRRMCPRMLSVIGAGSIDELFDEIPEALKAGALHGVPDALCEMEVARLLTERAAADGRLLNFIGAGAYEHHIPAPVWAIATRGEFYSAYTPYQAEASQGTLQLIYEYQSMICALTGMQAANASLYDGASALAEACLMAIRAKAGVAAHSDTPHRESHLREGRARRSPAIRTSSSRARIDRRTGRTTSRR